jgi:catalase
MSEIEKAHIIAALGFELDHCDDPAVYECMVARLCDISLELAQAVAERAGAPTPTKAKRENHGKIVKGLSQFDLTPEALGFPPTIASRMIAIIIGEGFNFTEYEAVKAALSAAGAFVFTIGPKRQPVKSPGRQSISPDHHFEGMRSTMFDSLYIPGGEHVSSLLTQGRVIHWIREASGHCKAIYWCYWGGG